MQRGSIQGHSTTCAGFPGNRLSKPNLTVTVAPILALDAVRAYEANGPQGFATFAKDTVDSNERKLYLLDGSYHDVLGRPVTEDGQRLAHLARMGQVTVFRSHITAYRYVSATGKPYIVLLYTNLSEGVADRGVLLYGSVLIFGVTALCFGLAHHLASPIVSIQEAARRVSLGDLDARAPARLLRRHDELRDLTLDFNIMIERIGALVNTQKSLLASVSHEVRSPLTRLALAIALLRRQDRTGNTVLLDRLDREIATLNTLMSQLLTLARLEGGVRQSGMAPLELAPLLEEIAADANFEIGAIR